MRSVFFAAIMGLVFCSSANAGTLEDLLIEQGMITKGQTASVSAAAIPKIYWNDGTRIEFPDTGFTTQITTFIKNAYIYTDKPQGQEDTSSFDVRNVRIVLSGSALNQEFNYRLEYDVALNRALDGFISWNTAPWLELKLGQFKTPMSRQFVNHSFKLMFPDASYASNYFSYGYQKAAKVTAKLLDGQLVAGASLTNGNSDGEGPYASGIDNKNMLTADLRWNALGKMNAYEESDVNYTEDLAMSFAAVYAYSPQMNKLGETTQELDVSRVNLDANLKYQGLGINMEYYVSEENPEFGESWTTQGAYAQAGYFIVPGKFEAAGRWSFVDCDNGQGLGVCQGTDDYNQLTAGMNYYFAKYNLKAQLAYDYLRGRLTDDTSSRQNRWMLQLIGIF